MEIKTYFFDTYAFFEIIKGNQNYSKFSKGINFITTKLNLMELYYGLLKKYGKDVADLNYDMNANHCISLTDESIKEAMIFKKENKGKDLSYTDCVGYIIAKKHGIKFLTGDKQFEFLPDVEFVR